MTSQWVDMVVGGIAALTMALVIVAMFVVHSPKNRIPKQGLFLDDVRCPDQISWISYPAGIRWYVARNLDDFVRYLQQENKFDVVSFDYHLGNAFCGLHNTELPTGVDALKRLIILSQKGKIEFPEKIVFHTQDPDGRNKMKVILDRHLKQSSKPK